MRTKLKTWMVVGFGILLMVWMSVVTYILNGFRYWSDGSTPVYSFAEHALFYGVVTAIPLAVAIFILCSPFRKRRGRGYKIFYWFIFVVLALASLAGLIVADEEMLLFAGPTIPFLWAWYPFRQDQRAS